MDAKSVNQSRAPSAAKPRFQVLPGLAPRAPSAGPPPYLADPSSPDAIALRQLLDDWKGRGDADAPLPRPTDAGAASPGEAGALTVEDTGSATPARVNARAGVVLRFPAQRREGKV